MTDSHQDRPTEAPRPSRRRVFRRRAFLLVAITVAVGFWAIWKYERFVLAPRAEATQGVRLDDLLADRWYETERGRILTAKLAKATDSRAMRFAKGVYYRDYKRRYGPGVKNSQYVRVGPDQYPEIHRMVADACSALNALSGEAIQIPEVWLGYNGSRSLEITNYTNPTIVIGNDFLWAYKPDELRYLLARQIGHLQCRHIYLLDITKGARSLIDSAIPDAFARILIGGLGGSLLEWTKEAQITADRAGLLVVGDVDLACRTLIKLNVHASLDDFYGNPDPETFAAQAQDLDEDHLTSAAAAFAELKNPNPFLTTRVADLLAFHRANASLFQDREKSDVATHAFDAGVDVPVSEAGQ